jgi:ribosomal protein S18 acetylase RimI-like enzyme
MHIRNFVFPADYQDVLTLWKNSGPGVHIHKSDSPEEIQKKLFRDPDLFLVAIEESTIIGSVIGGYDGRRGMIYHLAVNEQYRNKGIGKSLMEEIELRLKAKGCIRCYLLVTEDNVKTIDYYKTIGWDVMKVIPMAKDIE